MPRYVVATAITGRVDPVEIKKLVDLETITDVQKSSQENGTSVFFHDQPTPVMFLENIDWFVLKMNQRNTERETMSAMRGPAETEHPES